MNFRHFYANSGLLLSAGITGFTCCLFVLLTGCSNDRQAKALEAKGEPMIERLGTLFCEQSNLEKETRELWDGVAKNLEAQLPKDMPADERRNMITIRNRELIQMFEIYPSLDTSIRQLVEKAGDADVAIVVKLRNLQQDISAEETQFIAFLAELESRDPKAANVWKARLAEIKEKPCTAKKAE